MEGSQIYQMTIITIIYILAIVYLGYKGYKKTRTATDFLVAGRGIHPYVMALSYGATFISTSAIVGFGGAAALFGFGLLWLTFANIFIGIFIAFVFFGKRTRQMGYHLQAHTFPELLGRRFQSRFIQIFSGMVIFLFMPIYSAVVLIGGARFIEETFAMNYYIALAIFSIIIAAYVIAGGLKGVMYTDALQGSIMLIGMAILLFSTYYRLGGPVEAHKALVALSDKMPEKLVKGGLHSWTSMPTLFSPMWWTLVSTIILGVGIGVLAQPQLAVRFMTVKSSRELNRAVLIGGIFIMMMTGTAFIVGSLSNVFFVNHPEYGKISIAVAGGNVDKIIPMFIKAAMPSWFILLFMLTLLSAAMSTVSSQFHAMGSAIGRDVYEQAAGVSTESNQKGSTVLITRVGIIVAISLTITIAFVLPGSIIARGTALFFGLCAVAFLPMYVAALYWKGATRAGAVSSLVIGFIISLFWLLFVHGKNAEMIGVCNLLTGKPYLFNTKIKFVDPLVIGLPISAIIMYIVSLITRKPSEEHLRRCFTGIK